MNAPRSPIFALVFLTAQALACAPPPPRPRAAPHAPAAQASAQPATEQKLSDAQLGRLGELLNPVQEAPRAPASAALADVSPSVWTAEADADDAGDPQALKSLWSGASRGRARAAGTPSEVEQRAIARVLCESSSVTRRGAGFQCSTCPSYTEFAGEPHGMSIVAFFPGSFSGPKRDEVLISTSGCASGAGSGQSYGGRALVKRTAGGWQRAFYEPGALGQCTPVVSGRGRSRLFCHVSAGHMGEYSETFGLAGFDEIGGKIEARDVLGLGFVTRDKAYLRGFDKGPLHMIDLVSFAVAGKAKYEAGDDRALSFEVAVRSSLDCLGGASECPGADRSAFAARFRLVYDGSAFHLAPESLPAFARLRARDHR